MNLVGSDAIGHAQGANDDKQDVRKRTECAGTAVVAPAAVLTLDEETRQWMTTDSSCTAADAPDNHFTFSAFEKLESFSSSTSTAQQQDTPSIHTVEDTNANTNEESLEEASSPRAVTPTTISTVPGTATITLPPCPSTKKPVSAETLKLHRAVAAGDLLFVQNFINQKIGLPAEFSTRQLDRDFTEARARRFAGLGDCFSESEEVKRLEDSETDPLEARDRRGRSLLHTACVEGRAEVVRALLRGGANANVFDDAGFSPLHRCAQINDLDSTRALLAPRDLGMASIDADALTRRGDYRPLHLACLAGADDVVGLLVRRGADVSASDRWGCTPLHRACLEGHLRAARTVLNAGADVDARDNWKNTPLHRACRNGHKEVVQLLLQKDASTSAKDDLMERPGQSFMEGVSGELQEAIGAMLKEKRDSRNNLEGPGAGRGSKQTPAWSRTRSADPAPGKAKRSPNRYIPPAARKLLEENATRTTLDSHDDGGGGRVDDADVESNSSSIVQPWRRRTSTWSGIPDDGRGNDYDYDESGRTVEGTLPAQGEASFATTLRAGRGSVSDTAMDADMADARNVGGGMSGDGTGDMGTLGSEAGGGLSDLHTDVFSVGGDDWGLLF